MEPLEDEGAPEALGELAAVRLLCSSLARLLSYPTPDEAEVFTNRESLDFLAGLAGQALLEDEAVVELYRAAVAGTEDGAARRAQLMRRTFTQLFYRPDAPIPLEGRRWIRRDPSEAEARLGEEASVRQCYRAVGARVRPGVVERACALPSELDFVAYLLGREIDCSAAGDGARALVWKRRRTAFVERHLSAFGEAVAARIEEESPWPLLRFWAALLARVVRRCAI